MFQFLEMNGFDATTSNIKGVIVSTNIYEHRFTNEQIR